MSTIKVPLTIVIVAAMAVIGTGPLVADFDADLRQALAIHDRASSLEEQSKALEALQEIASQYPDRWRGHFWTAYEETQIHMLHTRQQETTDARTTDLGAYLDRAQEHLSKAEALHDAATPRERSSMAGLQSLIDTFRSNLDQANSEAWRAKARQSLLRSAELDPDNPVLLVFIGTHLTGQARNEGDWRLLIAARHLFRRAQAETEGIEDRTQTTAFNAEWIQFWLPSAERMLEQHDID